MRLKYVHEVNGCLYVRRVIKVDGKRKEIYKRLPSLDAANFWDEYQRLAGIQRKSTMKKNSMSELIDRYRKSSLYRKNAPNTQKNKDRYLDMIEERWGPYDFTTLKRDRVVQFRDEFFDTPGKADNLVSTLSALMGWAVKNEWLARNPCHDIERLCDGERDPWPDEVIERAIAASAPMLRLAIQAHYYTGQRIGDVCAMNRPRSADEAIPVTQEKTGEQVTIPLHRDFWTAIQAVPPLYQVPAVSPLLYGRDGQRFTPDALRDRLRRVMADIGEDYKFHGLRKNAVNALLEAGASEYQVSSITGQSPEQVKHYAKKVNRKKLAKAAVRKWESGKS